jgi:hypothetical protein
MSPWTPKCCANPLSIVRRKSAGIEEEPHPTISFDKHQFAAILERHLERSIAAEDDYRNVPTDLLWRFCRKLDRRLGDAQTPKIRRRGYNLSDLFTN